MAVELTPADLEMFARLRIPPEMLERAGVCRVTDAEARERYGITGSGDMAGIVFPYLDPVTGDRVTARLRRDHPEIGPDGRPERKYICPSGDNRHLYFPPGSGPLLSDTSVPTVLIEAEKSSLSIAVLADLEGRKMLTVATGGCYGWHGKTGIETGPNGEREETRGPLPDLDRITWQRRTVLIIFDANVRSNPQVASARKAFAQELSNRGAEVSLVGLPEERRLNGPDDYIAAHGREALLRLIDDEVTFTELARMRPVDYDRVRKATAKGLGIRATALDAEVEARRTVRQMQQDSPGDSARPNRLARMVVNAESLLSGIATLVRRYVVLTAAQLVAVVLWVVHTYVLAAADFTPYL